MRDQFSTTNLGTNPGFASSLPTSLSFEGVPDTGSTTDPPDNQGGGTTAPEPENAKANPQEKEVQTESD